MYKQMKINIPEDVKNWLLEESNRNMRSQTAEIILALKEKMTSKPETQKGEVTA